ncbi:hypothetical protein Clacol_009321 [Clathrus columnatus]|uniref:Uncharacterized protein n=1 Tax=Clathrus columnatus TaxID=1419009 RepID=A0AAV5AK59_9AGAM|nr:hypothetical protein Clacol_009321 [Clathrus columnatus]
MSFPSYNSPFLTPKCAIDWDSKDLVALNVSAERLTVEQFFGCHVEELPLPTFEYAHFQETWDAGVAPFYNENLAKNLSVRNFHELIGRVGRSFKEVQAKYGIPEAWSECDNLQGELNFSMNNVDSIAKVDLSIEDVNQKLLCLFSENEPVRLKTDWPVAHIRPIPQIVAKAFAKALAVATRNLDGQSGEDRFCDVVIPAFSFNGSWPCFYIIPITAAFRMAVSRGEEPPHPTKVFYCEAPIKNEFYGMALTEQHRTILRMLEAFKRFIPTNLAQTCRFSGMQGDFIPKAINPALKTNVWVWVLRFLWECEESCRRSGINKQEYLHDMLPDTPKTA